jgi:hypothetical protein
MTTETLTKIIVDCSTGIQTEVPMTSEEVAEWNARKAQAEADAIAEEAAAKALAELKASAKAKLIAGEPLTEEEADTLVI